MSGVLKNFEEKLDGLVAEQVIQGDLARQVDLLKVMVRSEIDHANEKIEIIKAENERLTIALSSYIKACSHASSAMLLLIKTKKRKNVEMMELYAMYDGIINEATAKVANIFKYSDVVGVSKGDGK